MSNKKKCEICDDEPIIHQCKGGCDKYVGDNCGYKCLGNCGNVVCRNCHWKHVEDRISPEKTHYYCNNCIKRYDMG